MPSGNHVNVVGGVVGTVWICSGISTAEPSGPSTTGARRVQSTDHPAESPRR